MNRVPLERLAIYAENFRLDHKHLDGLLEVCNGVKKGLLYRF